MGRPHYHSSPDECLGCFQALMCFCVQFWFPAVQGHGRHPGTSAKGALCCYQVQTVPLQQTPGGPPSLQQLGQSRQGTPALPLLQPCPVTTTREGPAGHMHGVAGGGAPASHVSSPLYPHSTSHTCPRVPSRPAPRPACSSGRTFPLTRWGARKRPGEPTLKHRLNARDLTAARGRNVGGTCIEYHVIMAPR